MGSSTDCVYPDIGIIREGICLNLQQQRQLVCDMSQEENYAALLAMPDEKAPGVDGFPIEFYKKNWHTVSEDIFLVVTSFFQTSTLDKAINVTTLTLVPKIKNPSYAKDFRQIACCTTIYKIISKVITTRLKSVVRFLVGDSQSAFIEGRNITDNILLSHELLRGCGRKHLSPRCTIKVHLRKAYDSLNWNFMRIMLLELGIPYRFVCLIMKCVTTVSYSLNLNGGFTMPFPAKKGLRQGDPMSPYLSVLAMEYLQRILNRLALNANFNFHPKCSRLGIMHLCFADDLLLFCRADATSITVLKETFEEFSIPTGLDANNDKSNVFLAGVT